jgi:dinuclear metal center YbgI/SA1388 family protein
MMKIQEVMDCLENFAHKSLQEDYDNAGLIIGDAGEDCSGILTTLDVTEEIIEEALEKKCNLIVAHHPIIFKGLKKINGKNYVERVVIAAIKNNIAIYAIHTNLDNVLHGVNLKIAEKLNLRNIEVLSPKENTLKKLVTFSPLVNAEEIRNALFKTGAGTLGNYAECSYNVEGFGTFKAGESAQPFVGKQGEQHVEKEVRIEVVFPTHLVKEIIKVLKEVHPYEEVAYDIYALGNERKDIGSGLIGELENPLSEMDLLYVLKEKFKISAIKHTAFLHKKIKKIALCGGSGSFLISTAKSLGADSYITADIKYHEFFDADHAIFLADIGHYESEQFTMELLTDILQQNFPNFAVLKTGVNTNPVKYYV